MANEGFSEKVSVNINSSTLSQIDLLVDNGYYSNRSDFINQALRESLQRQGSVVDRIVKERSEPAEGRSWFIGAFFLDAPAVEQLLRKGKTEAISGYGVLKIEKDIQEEKLFAAVSRIEVKGKVICSPSVKAHYGLK